MSFSFSEELVNHYHRELQEVLDSEGIEAFRIGGGETTATKQLSICFGGDTKARLQSFKNQMKHLGLNVDLTHAKYNVRNIGAVHLANSLIGYMLADVIVLCFDNSESVEKWLQDVEYAFLTLQKPVNKDKTIAISCVLPEFTQSFNNAKKQINTLIELLHQIGFSSDVIKINFGHFGLSSNHINELLKEKGKNTSVGYGGMVLIPSGVNRYLPDSELGSEIRIEKPFLMSQGQITQDLYEHIIGENPSHFRGAEKPVEQVSWFDLLEFSNKLSGKEVCYTDIVKRGKGAAEWREDCTGYRLPTEQEWEYACRAFSNYTYSGSNNAEDVAWFADHYSVRPVGQLKMNGFGLYDMSGNVWEWCWELHASTSANRLFVLRGGSWIFVADSIRAASRITYPPAINKFDIGGRLSRSLR